VSLPTLKTISRRVGAVGGTAMLMVGGVGLVPASAAPELPIPTATVTIAPPTCNVDHAVVTVTDTTPTSPLVGFYFEKVTSARGLEGQPPDSITALSSVTITTLPVAFGQTVVLTVQSLADTPNGNSKWYVVASGRAVTRPTAAQCATPKSVTPVAPTFVDGPRTADYYQVANTLNVNYLVNGVIRTPGTKYTASGTVTVTSQAKTGAVLKTGATSSWTFKFTDVSTPTVVPLADPAAIIPVGAPRTGAGGASNSGDSPLTGLGGLALLLGAVAMVPAIRRRRHV
jgi:hypothetical protein